MVQPLVTWSSEDRALEALVSGGLSPEAARLAAPLFARAAAVLMQSGVSAELAAGARWVPGRLEVLGKHTDYAGGRSLTCAVERGFAIVFVACQERSLIVHALDDGESQRFALFGDSQRENEGWRLYPATLATRLAGDAPDLQWGVECAIASNLPRDAGLSSSSALIVALFQAVAAANERFEGTPLGEAIATPEQEAAYLSCVEAGRPFAGLGEAAVGVGTRGGSEDQVAVLCSRAGELGLYRYRPIERLGSLPLPEGWTFAIGGSGVAAHKAGGAKDAYNRAADLMAAWEAGDVSEEPRRRYAHFIAEDRLVQEAAESLQANDSAAFADFVANSQELGAKMLGNQIPETIELAEAASVCGAACASAFGAGFGGSVWALVRENYAETFLEIWRARYAQTFPDAAQKGEFFATRPGPPAFRLK